MNASSEFAWGNQRQHQRGQVEMHSENVNGMICLLFGELVKFQASFIWVLLVQVVSLSIRAGRDIYTLWT